jgi:uncharacterized membrane protein YphA (DoxX/SURF4 family)
LTYYFILITCQQERNLKGERVMARVIGETGGNYMDTAVRESSPAYQAFWILRAAFTIAPIVAGLDKFLHILVNWDQYLPPFVNQIVGGYGHELMLVVGIIEIVAGIGVALKPGIFAYVVSAWLFLIVVNLLMIPAYFDVALRDVGLALGALALARLSHEFDH